MDALLVTCCSPDLASSPSSLCIVGLERSCVEQIYRITGDTRDARFSLSTIMPKHHEAKYDCLTPLNSSVHVHITPQPTSIILFCPWMGAPPRPITKIVQRLQREFESSIVILIQSRASQIFFPFLSDFDTALKPVTMLLQNYDIPITGLIYSNGGCFSLCQLAHLYRQTTHTSLRLHKTIFDSCPGGDDLVSARLALIASSPNAIVSNIISRSISTCIISLSLFFLSLMFTLFRVRNPITEIRRQLNDPSLFDIHGGRTYIYGKTDRICTLEKIESNIQDAKRAGFMVKGEVFESGHVRHAVVDPERYWGIVDSLGS